REPRRAGALQRAVPRGAGAGVREVPQSDPAMSARSKRLKWGTRAVGAVSVSTVAVLLGAETVRVWRLGSLPLTHGGEPQDMTTNPVVRAKSILVEGYRVSSTRENAILNMVASFITTFAITRGITHT